MTEEERKRREKEKNQNQDDFNLDDIVLGDPDDKQDEDRTLPIDDDSDDSSKEKKSNNKDQKSDDSDDDPDDSSSDDDSDKSKSENNDNQDDDGDSVVVSLLADSGYEFTDEELGNIDDTEESLDKAVNLIATKRAEEQFNEEYGGFDDVREYLEYRKNGGSPDNYFEMRSQEVSLENTEVSEEDVTLQRNIVRENLKAQGYDDSAVEEEIGELEEGDKLFARAQRNLDVMKKNAKVQKEQALEQQDEERKKAIKQYNETKEKAKEIAKSNKLPIKVDENIDEYLYGNDPTKPSQYMLDAQDLTQEQMLLVAQLVKSGMNLDKLVKNEAKTISSNSLKEKLKKNRARGGNAPQNQDEDFEIPDVNDLK